jgi:hypothetical protein
LAETLDRDRCFAIFHTRLKGKNSFRTPTSTEGEKLEELRSHYMSSIHVNFKHSPFLQKELILKFLETVDRDIKTTENRTSLVIDSEEKIPPIIQAFTKHKIDIYIELMYMNLL